MPVVSITMGYGGGAQYEGAEQHRAQAPPCSEPEPWVGSYICTDAAILIDGQNVSLADERVAPPQT